MENEILKRSENIKAYYINLESSKDRKENIEKLDFVIPLNRFNARFDDFGELGCALSHYFLLERVKRDATSEYTIVIEDDFTITNNDKYKQFLLDLLDLLETKKPDAVVFAGTRKIINKDIKYKNFLKLDSCNTTTGYIIKNSYISKLTDVLKGCVHILKVIKDMESSRRWVYRAMFPIDQMWTVLQSKDNWYVYNDSTIMGQKEGYSIIGKSKTEFKDLFTTSAVMTTGQIEAFKGFKWRRLADAFQDFYWNERCLEWLFYEGGENGRAMKKVTIEESGIIKI